MYPWQKLRAPRSDARRLGLSVILPCQSLWYLPRKDSCHLSSTIVKAVRRPRTDGARTTQLRQMAARNCEEIQRFLLKVRAPEWDGTPLQLYNLLSNFLENHASASKFAFQFGLM